MHLTIKAERGSKYACPVCGKACPAQDLGVQISRVKCPDHGVKLVDVPWARKGSAFTLLFEQAALTLVREMPVNAAARIMEITDKRLWRVVQHYVGGSDSKPSLVDNRHALLLTPGKGKETRRRWKSTTGIANESNCPRR